MPPKNGLARLPDRDPILTAEHLEPVWAGRRTITACYECNNGRSSELNQTKRGSKFAIGDETPSSSFAVLQVLLRAGA
jgi:hypothetical protein